MAENYIKVRHGSSVPTTNTQLRPWEMGVSTSNNALYINTSDTTTANMVGYLPLTAGQNAKLTDRLYLTNEYGTARIGIGSAGGVTIVATVSESDPTATVGFHSFISSGKGYANLYGYNGGEIRFFPNGLANTSGQVTINASGDITLPNGTLINGVSNNIPYLRIDGPITATHITFNQNGTVYLAGSGTLYLRPNNSATGQTTISTAGTMNIDGNLTMTGEQTSGHSYGTDGSTTSAAISSAWSEHAIKSFTGLETGGHYILIGYCVVKPTTTGNARLTIQGYRESDASYHNIAHQIFPLPYTSNNWCMITYISTGYTRYRFCLTCGTGSLENWTFRYIRIC